MNDTFENMPINEDDVVMDLRYHFCYIANAGIEFREKWVEELITHAFKGYTFNNSVRLNQIMAVEDNCVLFDVKLVTPDVAPETIADDIHERLHEAVKSAFQENSDDMWKETKVLSIGDETKIGETI